MNVYISVINHHHDDIIIKSDTLANLAKEFRVVLKSNTLASNRLKEYCSLGNIDLIQGSKFQGFSENNNEVFYFIYEKYTPNQQDFFLVLNPDVEVSSSSVYKLIMLSKSCNADISAINLYKDKELTIYDYSIRKFPSIYNPLKSILKIKRNDFYDKSIIKQPVEIDWAAGSFLLFKISCFKQLNGFDKGYFMYFEDVDICRRAKQQGKRVIYFPDIEAIHLAMHKNRKLFSKHIIWYCLSSLRYFSKNITLKCNT
jgi:N-acetylglucosaminyl-diphospho-decaprenol L-rhamnosyltransferase